MQVLGTLPSKGCQTPCLPPREWLWINGFLAAGIIHHSLNQVLILTNVCLFPHHWGQVLKWGLLWNWLATMGFYELTVSSFNTFGGLHWRKTPESLSRPLSAANTNYPIGPWQGSISCFLTLFAYGSKSPWTVLLVFLFLVAKLSKNWLDSW